MLIHKEFTQAPEFEFRTLEGDFVKSSDLNNKVVVLGFWATWCAPCIRQFPEIQSLVDEFKNQPDVAFYMVNTGQAGDSLRQVQSFLELYPYDFPVVYDAAARVSRKLAVQRIPQLLVIDRKGIIRLREIGYLEGGDKISAKLSRYIREFLEESRRAK
ncbi:MAG: TlpA family protein disulfide reductase [Calditrichaeota bacterium]|nr:MAG: TlpA family protein disulfide reductase [Calditrichota bacterium]